MDTERTRYAAKVCGIAAVYYGAAKLGLSLAFATASVTAIWPPTGIALAALVIGGYRLWPGVALGAFLANAWTGVPIYTVLGITTGNTLEALTGAFLLYRLADFRPALERVRDVIALVVLGGVVSTMVSATIGVGSLLAGGEIVAGDIGSVWRTWWLGDMGGDLLVAPFLMVAVTHWPYRRAPGGAPEAVALALVLVGLSAFVFSRSESLTYVVFPPLIWATLRFWQPGATSASLIVAAVAVWFTDHDMGPWAGNTPDERLLLAQTFVGAVGITSLVLAAVITERRRAEEAVEKIAGALQQSLLPSHPPDIPGIEIAADFRPAGEHNIVGGDFYDMFETDAGSWAVIIGDALGHGADAAALTGLARHTLRAAAVREPRPSRVLRFLNDEILRQAPWQVCTVAYARLEPAGSAGARLTVSSGGHPLPLVLRVDGTVEQLGSPGTMLGAMPDPQLTDSTAELEVGDAVVLYTDGLTEAYAPGRVVAVPELASVVASCAGRGAPAILSAVEGALLEAGGGEPRDDIVVLVLRVRSSPDPARDAGLGRRMTA
jgi:integral membrane sensor domain MASE1